MISNLKRGFNLFRCEWKTRERFDAKIYWNVIAYNIRVMTGALLLKIQPQLQQVFLTEKKTIIGILMFIAIRKVLPSSSVNSRMVITVKKRCSDLAAS